MEKLIKEIKERLNTKVTKREIERLFSTYLTYDNFWNIVEKSKLPFNLVSKLTNFFIKEEWLKKEENRLISTLKLKEFCEKNNIKPLKLFPCNLCNSTGVNIEPLKDIYNKFKEISLKRPKPLAEFGQGYVTEDTTIRRIAFCWEQGDLYKKDIIILGDDDLLGIGLALTNQAKKITVIDIDQRVIKFTEQIIKNYNLKNIEVHELDMRYPLPEKFIKKYDVFFTDPPDTFEGTKVFLERGLLSLKGIGAAGYFGQTHIETTYYKWQKIQKFLLNKGIVITHLIDFFNTYVTWDYLTEMECWKNIPIKQLPNTYWYKSAYYRIEVLEELKLDNKEIDLDNIIEDEDSL